MKQKIRWDDIIGIFFWMLSVGLLGVSAFLCFSEDIWYDELFTMGFAKKPLGELISLTARDVHPPLYYMIVKLFLIVFSWMGDGSFQVMIIKLASVLPFFLCIMYSLTKVRRHFGMFSAGLFCFLIISAPQLADYTVEMRMYGYAIFFVTAGMLHAYELVWMENGRKEAERRLLAFTSEHVPAWDGLRQEKHGRGLGYWFHWFMLTFYSIAACYTHYFACIGACMVYIYLFAAFVREERLRAEIKGFLLSSLACVAGYLPWLLTAVPEQVGQIKENYWILPLSWRNVGGCAKFLFQPFFSNEMLSAALAVILAVCYGGLFVALLVSMLRTGWEVARRRKFFIASCVGVLIGLVLFGFLASFLVRPIFVYRYMLPALGVFWLAFAIMVSYLTKRKWIFFPLMLLVLVTGLRNYYSFYGEEMWKQVQMANAENVLSQIGEEDIVICNFDQTQAVVTYYLANDTYLWYGKPEELIREIYPGNHALVEGEFSDEAGIDELKKMLSEGKTIWFVGSGNARDEILEKWANSGIESEEIASAMIERYWFNLYRIFGRNA